jgi:hypothetical protein
MGCIISSSESSSVAESSTTMGFTGLAWIERELGFLATALDRYLSIMIEPVYVDIKHTQTRFRFSSLGTRREVAVEESNDHMTSKHVKPNHFIS